MSHHLTQFFTYGHLPAHLQAVSQPFSELADAVTGCVTTAPGKLTEAIGWIERTLPSNPEATWAQTKLDEAERMTRAYCGSAPGTVPGIDEILRKVLEAKDCAVRAVLCKAPQ